MTTQHHSPEDSVRLFGRQFIDPVDTSTPHTEVVKLSSALDRITGLAIKQVLDSAPDIHSASARIGEVADLAGSEYTNLVARTLGVSSLPDTDFTALLAEGDAFGDAFFQGRIGD